jgi:hypothetical protein
VEKIDHSDYFLSCIHDITETSDGAYSYSAYAELPGQALTKIFLHKLDVNGNEIWQKTYSQENYIGIPYIESGNDGEIFMIVGFEDLQMNYGSATNILYKLNENGDIVIKNYSHIYQIPTPSEKYNQSFIRTADKGLLLSGGLKFGMDHVPFIIKFDSLQLNYPYNSTWNCYFECDQYTTEICQGDSTLINIRIISGVSPFTTYINGSTVGKILFIAADTSSYAYYFSPTIANPSSTIQMTDSDGDSYQKEIHYIVIDCTNLNHEFSELKRAKIFPNPASDVFTISNIDKANKIELYNISGKLMKILIPPIGEQNCNINSSSYPAGVYQYKNYL